MRIENKKGASLVEYGSLVGLLSVLAVSSVLALGDRADGVFSEAAASLSNSVPRANDGGVAVLNPPGNHSVPACASATPGPGGQGYFVDLGSDGALSVGDTILGGGCYFQAASTIGAGNWMWSGASGPGSFTNEVEPGIYFLGTDGHTYFRPDFGTDLTITSATAQ